MNMFLKNQVKCCFFVIFGISSIFSMWTDDAVQKELITNKPAILKVREELGEKIPLSLAMAKWASQKARTGEETLKYTRLAREILNEARGFGWAKRAPTSQESACMALTSIDIALVSNDDIDSLCDGSGKLGYHSDLPHFKYLKQVAIAARFVASKTPYLTESGIVTWARAPGVRNFLVDATEAMRPENLSNFFTPSVDRVSITKSTINWQEISKDPSNWKLTQDTTERLLIADGIIRKHNKKWIGADATTLAEVRDTYTELRRLKISADLLESSDEQSKAVERGYSSSKIVKLTPVFLLLDPLNFREKLELDGFGDDGFLVGNIKIESATSKWSSYLNKDFSQDFSRISKLLSTMEGIMISPNVDVHKLDKFQKDNTKEIFSLGQKYFKDMYKTRLTKEGLIADINERLTSLGKSISVHYDASVLEQAEIIKHLGYVLKGYPYPSLRRGALESEIHLDGVTEAEWLEIISIIFDVSQSIDSFRLNVGIDTTPFNLESTFYQQLYENQFTGGGCVPGRKNRILYRLSNILRQWVTFGYRLA